jgi:type I restriction enzyme S subunit
LTTQSATIVQRLWNYCNVLRDDGVCYGNECGIRLLLFRRLGKALQANLARAERLRQAILKKAFDGRLVDQDPDDEPASVLLERIRSSRKGAKPLR